MDQLKNIWSGLQNGQAYVSNLTTFVAKFLNHFVDIIGIGLKCYLSNYGNFILLVILIWSLKICSKYAITIVIKEKTCFENF